MPDEREARYACDHCRASFDEWAELERHEAKHHAGNRPRPASAPSAPPTLLSEAECEAMRPRYEHFSEVLKLLATVAALRAELTSLRSLLESGDALP